jgi:hypothetical protein
MTRTNVSSSTIRTKAGRRDIEGAEGNTHREIPVHGPACPASMKTPHAGYKVALAAFGSRVARSNLDAADKPEHEDNDQYQTENAAQSRPAPPIVAMVATEAAEQQDHQDDN